MDSDALPSAQLALYDEMARQIADSRASILQAQPLGEEIAASLRRTKCLLLLGMGGSHAAGRAVEPLYRAHGIETFALPVSDQLSQPLSLQGKTVIITSQSGESAEVLRWFDEMSQEPDVYGLTMEADSSLASLAPSLIGAGGTEIPFAATRSLTVTLALHAAILQALGDDLSDLHALWERDDDHTFDAAIKLMANVTSIVTSGRQLLGVAEAVALGLTELSRLPCYGLEGGQFRHGPVEMLGPNVGVILFRAADETRDLVTGLGRFVVEAGSPLIVFDASGEAPIEGAVTLTCPQAKGLTAIFSLLPVAQRFMVDFAATRVDNVGLPVRSTKVTRVE
jgi:fructoselysine-6-P-deglycase FrlB-like protein